MMTPYAAKLTWDEVDEIRGLAKAGMRNFEIAKRFNVHRSTIGRIVDGVSWPVTVQLENENVGA